jgi:hypothetical protein
VEKTSIARLQQPKQLAVAGEWLCKTRFYVNRVTQKQHITIEEPLEAVIYVGSVQRLYKERQLGLWVILETGSLQAVEARRSLEPMARSCGHDEL